MWFTVWHGIFTLVDVERNLGKFCFSGSWVTIWHPYHFFVQFTSIWMQSKWIWIVLVTVWKTLHNYFSWFLWSHTTVMCSILFPCKSESIKTCCILYVLSSYIFKWKNRGVTDIGKQLFVSVLGMINPSEWADASTTCCLSVYIHNHRLLSFMPHCGIFFCFWRNLFVVVACAQQLPSTLVQLHDPYIESALLLVKAPL